MVANGGAATGGLPIAGELRTYGATEHPPRTIPMCTSIPECHNKSDTLPLVPGIPVSVGRGDS